MESQTSEKSPKKSSNASPTQAPRLLEKRFVAEWNRPDWPAIGALVCSGLPLGAGCFASFVMDPPADYRSFLLLGGVAAGALCLFRLTSGNSIVFVGDAGVAVEQRGEQVRLLWSEMTSIRYDGQQLVLSAANSSLALPSTRHSRAIRAVLAEAAERLPKLLDVPNKLLDNLPAVQGEGPKAELVQTLQIAGKRCLITKEILTFERDARVCPVCTSVYHRDHVPSTCATCSRPLGDSALAVGQ